jgi:hypothetical protein
MTSAQHFRYFTRLLNHFLTWTEAQGYELSLIWVHEAGFQLLRWRRETPLHARANYVFLAAHWIGMDPMNYWYPDTQPVFIYAWEDSVYWRALGEKMTREPTAPARSNTPLLPPDRDTGNTALPQ